MCEWVKVAQSCSSLCDPMDYTVYGILQARILEWVAFPFSRVSSQPRDWTQVSCVAGGFFPSWATPVVYTHFLLFLPIWPFQNFKPNIYFLSKLRNEEKSLKGKRRVVAHVWLCLSAAFLSFWPKAKTPLPMYMQYISTFLYQILLVNLML